MWKGHSAKNGPGGGIQRPYPGFNVAPSLLAKSAQLYNYVQKGIKRNSNVCRSPGCEDHDFCPVFYSLVWTLSRITDGATVLHLGILLKGFLRKFRHSGKAGQNPTRHAGLHCLSVGTYQGNLEVECPSVVTMLHCHTHFVDCDMHFTLSNAFSGL